MDTSRHDEIVRALKRLTIAVWMLTGVMLVFVGLYVAAYLPWLTFGSSSEVGNAPAATVRPEARYENFYALPLEKKIEVASVIAIAKYQKDGDRNKCIISEILKSAPGTKFYYNVGDEFRQCSHYPKSGEDRGDGQLMYFVGNPAEFRYSSSFYGDRLGGLGDMPLNVLRKQIEAAGTK